MTVTIHVEEPDAPTGRTCVNGHLVANENAIPVTGRNGRTYTQCRQCKNAALRRVAARRRGEQVPSHRTPARADADFDTAECWSVCPAELRRRLAGLLLLPPDDRSFDPLVVAAVRRAAKRRVWSRMGVSFATIALCEALIDEAREARSPRLRLDHLLRVVIGD